MKIVITPNPILNTPSAPVMKIDRQVLEFIEQMKKTLLTTINPKGVGLAAPQVGKNWQIFIAKPYEKSVIKVFLNPKIVEFSKEVTDGVPERDRKPCLPAGRLEGCLSIPQVWGMVKRYQTIKLQYKTPDNKQHSQIFTGFLATIIQHEMDHLNGRLFPSRTLEQKGKLYKMIHNQKNEEELEELKLTP